MWQDVASDLLVVLHKSDKADDDEVDEVDASGEDFETGSPRTGHNAQLCGAVARYGRLGVVVEEELGRALGRACVNGMP